MICPRSYTDAVTKSVRRPAAEKGGDLGGLLIALVEAVQNHFRKRVVEFGLTPSQANALHNLGEPRSQRELAATLKFDASNVTDIADRLEERGLVTRQIDPNDRRVRLLALTPEGKAVRSELFGGWIDAAPFVQTLTRAERTALRDLLAKVVDPPDMLA
jgi:MarR family transcriptional regulator, organic hydroperoxide resistance regulator